MADLRIITWKTQVITSVELKTIAGPFQKKIELRVVSRSHLSDQQGITVAIVFCQLYKERERERVSSVSCLRTEKLVFDKYFPPSIENCKPLVFEVRTTTTGIPVTGSIVSLSWVSTF